MGQAGRGDGFKRALEQGGTLADIREARTKRGRSAAASADDIRNGRQDTLEGVFKRIRARSFGDGLESRGVARRTAELGGGQGDRPSAADKGAAM